MADAFGRKQIYFYGTIVNLVLLTLFLISTNYWFTIVLIFLAGMFTTIRTSIGYTYTLELVRLDYKTLYSTIWLITNGSVFLFCDLYFAFISKHWFWLVAFGWVLNAAGCYYTYYLPESPTWLVKRGSYSAAQESLEFIA